MVSRIVIALMLFVSFSGKAQTLAQYGLYTDRETYTSGETILIKVFAPEDEQSGIVHFDLINTSGKIVAGINKYLSNHQADGYLYLTDSLKTDTYFLCASTNSSTTLTVKELFINNRFNGLSGTTSLLRAATVSPIKENPVVLSVDGINRGYKQREKAHLKIQLPTEVLEQLKEDLFVSIAESGPDGHYQTFSRQSNPLKNNFIEKEGVVLDGLAQDLKTGAPFKNGCILLSVPDSVPGFNYFITEADGRFNFPLNHQYGKIQIVVQGADFEKKRLLKISLNHRDSLPDGIPDLESKTLTSDFQQFAEDNREITNLSKIFKIQDLTVLDTPSAMKKDYPFYGVPTEVIYPNLFIDLPDFTEIARELLPGVKFRAYNRIPTMNILNPATLNYFSDPPLVLLNGVPVQDLNVIKNMGTKDIDKIEICRNERFFGDLIFPGVVAIYTPNPDYKRLTESNDLIKLTINTIGSDALLNNPDKLLSNEPDLRKVLLWKPSLKPEASIQIDFVTSDIRGNFKLIIGGKTKNGSMIYNEQLFEVN
jgi:hypothetical protein